MALCAMPGESGGLQRAFEKPVFTGSPAFAGDDIISYTARVYFVSSANTPFQSAGGASF